MKSEYDFSRGERGRFYNSEAVFNYPVYLEPDVEAFISQKATELHIEVQDLNGFE